MAIMHTESSFALCGSCASALGAVRLTALSNVCSRCLARGPAGGVVSVGDCNEHCPMTVLDDGRFHCEDHCRVLARKECGATFERLADGKLVTCVLAPGHHPSTAHAFAKDTRT